MSDDGPSSETARAGGDPAPGDDGDLTDTVAAMGERLAFNQHLGVTVRRVRPGRAEVGLPADDALLNHIGTPHAIAQLAPAELAGVAAAASRMPDLVEAGWVPVIAGLSARFHAAAPGDLLAVAEVGEDEVADARRDTEPGERVSLPVEIAIHTADDGGAGEHVATMTGYYVFLPPDT